MNDFTYSLDLHYDINSVKEAEEKLKELTDIRRRLERSIGEYKERRVKQFRITHRQGMLHDRTITFRQEKGQNVFFAVEDKERIGGKTTLQIIHALDKDEFLKLKQFILSIDEDELDQPLLTN